MFLEISTLAGLPAHALLVHAAVILVPLAVLALVATGWKASWRKAYSLPIAILAVAGAISAFLAKESGEPLEDAVKRAASRAGEQARFGDHPEQGDLAFIFALLFAMAAIGFWAADRYQEKFSLPKQSGIVSYGLAVAVAAVALVTMVIAGHSGAELVWKDVGSFAAGR